MLKQKHTHTNVSMYLSASDRATKVDPPYMLDVFEDYLYVSTYKQHKVMKFSKFYNASKDDTFYLKDASMFVGDIVTYQIEKQNLTNDDGKGF